MNSKPIFMVVGIIAVLGIVSITFSYGQTALADQGGDPNNSDQAQANADERHANSTPHRLYGQQLFREKNDFGI